MRKSRWLVAMFGAATASSGFVARDASACGGFFQPPTEVETVVSDHRMLLAISKTQTTLYDQVAYSGSPSSFAWVLPIKGAVTIGVSSDILFDTLDSLTATQVAEPQADCPAPPVCEDTPAEGKAVDAGAAADSGGGGVTVTAAQQVGPYETVQLHSSDGSALTQWLSSHGYSIPDAVAPIIAAYVTGQFDFLAMKLVPGTSVKAMRPVRVTTHGASPVLPLRMVAAGTGATTGITLWVLADGRYEPQNFPFFTISDSELIWDWTTNSSNYDTLRLAKEASLGGRGWQIESSLELNQYTISSTLLQNVDFSQDGGSYLPSDAGPTPGGDSGAGDPSADAGENPAAEADLVTLFAGISGGNVRVTRMRSDIAHLALNDDLMLQASADSSELSNLYATTGQIGQPLCPIYQGCTEVGEVPRDQAAAADGAVGGVGCNTARAAGRSDMLLVGLGGFAAFGLIRSRRKRRSRSRGA
jgi:hypothetical protein